MINDMDLVALFARDLDKVRAEIEQYEEKSLWKAPAGVSNCAGNLCLHICGNLNHFIGAVIGKNGYVRDRPFEFAGRVSKQELLDGIESTKGVLGEFLQTMKPEERYPIDVLQRSWKTGEFVINLYAHLNYHLGQLNYLRTIAP